MIKITWKVEGSDVTHEIPEKAVVCVEGNDKKVFVWLDEDNNVKKDEEII